jgi:simple sugar transport system permease protein
MSAGGASLAVAVATWGRASVLAAILRQLAAVAFALLVSGILLLLVGVNPIRAFGAIWDGAFGSFYQVTVGLAKAAPYLLCSVGISICFRANVINIGGEGQIALGGLAAAWTALTIPVGTPWLAIPLGLAAGAACGMIWGGIAAILHITRRVHEVLVTLMMNFIALLLIGEALSGSFGEIGSGFPQSPPIPTPSLLPTLWPGSRLHLGVLIAIGVAIAMHVFLWRTTFGFSIRSVGASRSAAAYAGISVPRVILMVMCVAGATAGLAGAVQVLGVHFRLIEGYSNGFGFVAVAIALLGAVNPLGQIPAALLFGFLETGALSMQRQMGIPSSLVQVIEGIVMLSVLAAMGSMAQRRRV